MMTSPTIHYSPDYNLRLMGLEELHPFDTGKAGKALELVRSRLGDAKVDSHVVSVTSEATPEMLELAHSRDYLASLTLSANVAAVLELPVVDELPVAMVDDLILRPMRLAVQGTLDAARSALTGGVAINLAGGFHHASHDRGSGFCVYADVVIALRVLWQEGMLKFGEKILYVDLDAHQGNGVCRLCQYYQLDDVFILDIYNRNIYPNDKVALKRIDGDVPLSPATGDAAYLSVLASVLPDAIRKSQPALVVYNAGTDILAGDPLGDLGVSHEGVVERDRYVIDTCKEEDLPLLIVPSGGYTQSSHRLIAEMLVHVLRSVEFKDDA